MLLYTGCARKCSQQFAVVKLQGMIDQMRAAMLRIRQTDAKEQRADGIVGTPEFRSHPLHPVASSLSGGSLLLSGNGSLLLNPGKRVGAGERMPLAQLWRVHRHLLQIIEVTDPVLQNVAGPQY